MKSLYRLLIACSAPENREFSQTENYFTKSSIELPSEEK